MSEKFDHSLFTRLPEFPRTPHVPYHAFNLDEGDIVAPDEDMQFLFTSTSLVIEEKIDGANMGMMLDGDHAVLRNREHILNKGYLKDTPAKLQFRPAWTWFYNNIKKFKKLNDFFGTTVGVYGEWCLALHGLTYNALPNYFIPFDIYDAERNGYVDSLTARKALEECGFIPVPLLRQGFIKGFYDLDNLINEKSAWSDERREGIYIKHSEGHVVTKRFKLIRPDFARNSGWSKDKITKQGLA